MTVIRYSFEKFHPKRTPFTVSCLEGQTCMTLSAPSIEFTVYANLN